MQITCQEFQYETEAKADSYTNVLWFKITFEINVYNVHV